MLAALILSVVVYIALLNFSVLQANVNPSPWFVDQSDLAVQVTNDGVEVHLMRRIEQLDSLSFLVFYNPDEVIWENDAVRSDYSVSVAEWNLWEATIILTFEEGGELVSNTKLVTIWASGDPYEMTISDAVFAFTNGSEERWSIAVE